MSNLVTFKSQFSGDIITPDDPGYLSSIARWAANAQRRAAVVAFVKSPSDVALAIAFARENGLSIAIRGGGHSPSGASSSEGGLVIDLSRYMNEVKVDPKAKLAYVGGGALWRTVDKETIKHGLATVAGTVNHTGVGGLTVGGGYGWLTGKHGLVIDNLVQATVVTASGSIVTTSLDSCPDLFFGIRGGGSNFGVVTEFVYRLHPQNATVYAGMIIFAPDALEQIIDVTKEWWSNVGQDEAMLQLVTVGPDGIPTIVCFLFFNGSEGHGRAKFKKLLDIGPLADLTKEIPYQKLNELLNNMASPRQCVYMKGVAHHIPHYPSIKEAHSRVIDFYKRYHPGPEPNPGFQPTVAFEYFPLAKVNSIPLGETAFRRDPTPGVVMVAVWNLTTEEDANLGQGEEMNTTIARKWAHEVAGILKSGQEGMTEAQWMGYANHDPEAVTGEPENVEQKAKAAFAGNYARLQEVKRKYDPEGLFNKWFPISPA